MVCCPSGQHGIAIKVVDLISTQIVAKALAVASIQCWVESLVPRKAAQALFSGFEPPLDPLAVLVYEPWCQIINAPSCKVPPIPWFFSGPDPSSIQCHPLDLH